MSRSVSAKAPTRLDFGGGWTDVPPYCVRESGYVCNVAIDRFATATVSDEPGSAMSDVRDEKLVDSALRRAGLRDVHVSMSNDYPVGAGLGGSSAASAALLGALRTWRDLPWDLREIAEEGRVIEVEDMQIAGGRQDHYAATHGGALGLRFTDTVDVDRIALSDAVRSKLEQRLLVVYTGESRISGDTITAVTDAYLARDRRVLASLRRMRELAEQMAAEVAAGDVDDLGEMVAEHWEFQRTLHPAIPTVLIDQIIATAKQAGAIGGKALGASGGGCVLLISRDDNCTNIRAKVDALGTVLPFHIALDGLSLA